MKYKIKLTSAIYLLLKLFNLNVTYDYYPLSTIDHPDKDRPEIDESIILEYYYFNDAVMLREFTWIA